MLLGGAGARLFPVSCGHWPDGKGCGGAGRGSQSALEGGAEEEGELEVVGVLEGEVGGALFVELEGLGEVVGNGGLAVLDGFPQQ